MNALRTWSLRSRLTLGIILLTAFGFILSSLVARQALEGYLVGQIDNQLITLTKSSLPIIAEAGIVEEESQENFQHRQEGRAHEERGARPRNPFSRIPTATSVTVLDVDGNVTGTIGGDLNSVRAADYLSGLTLQEILDRKSVV